jgi:hypothetical protein
MDTVHSLRTRIALGIALAGVLVAVGALALALRAAGERDPARRLRDDDLAVAESVAEARVLALRLQLGVAAAAAWPGDPALADRFRSDAARLADELQRVRLHAHDRAVTDVADDMENAVLRYRAGAEGVFAAAASGRGEEARTRAAALERAESVGLREFAEELATLTATRARARAERIQPGGRLWALLALAAGALVLAVEAALTALAAPAAAAPAASGFVRRSPTGIKPAHKPSTAVDATSTQPDGAHHWSAFPGEVAGPDPGTGKAVAEEGATSHRTDAA